MIPIKYIRESFEKDAAIHGETIKTVLRFVKKHPWLTIGAVGGVVGGTSIVHNLSKSILPTYHILNEENKRGIMKQENATLSRIEEYMAKSQQEKAQDPRFVPSIQPLA